MVWWGIWAIEDLKRYQDFVNDVWELRFLSFPGSDHVIVVVGLFIVSRDVWGALCCSYTSSLVYLLACIAAEVAPVPSSAVE